MKQKTVNSLLSLMLTAVLAFALLTGCASASPQSPAAQAAVSFTFLVTDDQGSEQSFDLSCAEGETLADALLAAGLISQQEHDSGFVTVVNGLTADYNADGAWWCLVDGEGEMSMVGIADINPQDGDTWQFIYTAD